MQIIQIPGMHKLPVFTPVLGMSILQYTHQERMCSVTVTLCPFSMVHSRNGDAAGRTLMSITGKTAARGTWRKHPTEVEEPERSTIPARYPRLRSYLRSLDTSLGCTVPCFYLDSLTIYSSEHEWTPQTQPFPKDLCLFLCSKMFQVHSCWNTPQTTCGVVA